MGRGKGKGKSKSKAKSKAKEKQTHLDDASSDDNEGLRVFSREIISNILSRLPVKSLLRFKCASKQWRSIISCPSFISLHLTRSPVSLLIYAPKPPISDKEEHPNGHVIFTHGPEPSTVVNIPDFPGFEAVGPNNQMEVIGSTPNGVVCIIQKPYAQKFTLWNPATRSSLSIPPSSLWPDPITLAGASAGIGFDPSSQEYKLIRVVRFRYQPLPDVAELFSFKTGRWKRIRNINNNGIAGAVPFRIQTSRCEAVVNGLPYWRALEAEADSKPSLKLVWFDVKESVFKSESTPWDMEERSVCMGEIREGFLGAVVWYDGEVTLRDRVLYVWLWRSESRVWFLTHQVSQQFTVLGRVVGFYDDSIMQEILLRAINDDTPRLVKTTLGDDVAVRDFLRIDGAWPGTCWVLSYRGSLTRMPTIRFTLIE